MKIKPVSYILAMTAALILWSSVLAHGPNSGILSGNRMDNNDYHVMAGMMDNDGRMHRSVDASNGFESKPNPYDLDESESVPYGRQAQDYQQEAENFKALKRGNKN